MSNTPKLSNHQLNRSQQNKGAFDVPVIRSPRVYRAAKALLNGEISTLELNRIVGDYSPRDLIYRMRNQGWLIDTLTGWAEDRDGKKVAANAYRINQAYRDTAQTAINTYKGEV